MHLNFGWTASQVIWTLTFAALLVLLVVLLGRERYKHFKMFSIGLVLLTFRMLASRLLYQKMAPINLYEIFIPLGLLSAIVSVLVVVELARRAFAGLSQRSWIAGTVGVVTVGAGVVAVWGTWPVWKTLTAGTTLGVLELLQIATQKIELLVNVTTVALTLQVLLFGRRYTAGWRTHVQGILIGLSTVSMAQMLRDGIWQLIVWKAAPHSQAEYDRIVALGDKLANASQVVFFAVLVWWIARLWLDEPGVSAAKPVEIEAATLTGGGVETGESEDDSSGSADRDISDEDPKP
ncbi:MAG: hypothetical protein ABSG51_17040 [Terracidiphilus sp.]|jgi:hypothetical protein